MHGAVLSQLFGLEVHCGHQDKSLSLVSISRGLAEMPAASVRKTRRDDLKSMLGVMEVFL